MEKYVQIKGFNGHYEVSNYGNVRSVDRIIPAHKGSRQLNIKGKLLKPSIDGGYKRVAIMLNGKLKTKKVHRLVAEHFCINDNPLNVVNHKDGNKLNNNADNLEWVSHKENVRHAFAMGLSKGLKGSSNPNSKLSEQDVLEIRAMAKLKRNYGRDSLAKKYGVSSKHIQDIVNSKTLWQ